MPLTLARWGVLACALGALAFAAGCGKKDEAKKKPATQVAAKVNSDEITVHQVNQALARRPNIPAESAPRAKREILTRLVDQQLAVQQATQKKLDRSPTVVQAVEAARAEILARAYAEEIAKAQPRPTAEEVKKYYAEHPELFAQRRIYNIEEFAVEPKEGLLQGLRDQLAVTKSMRDIGMWLLSHGVRITPSQGTRAAEQLPLEMLPALQKMKDGDIQVFELRNTINVVRIAGSRTAPIDETAAAPRIHQFLVNQRANEAVAADLKGLRAAAKIEYVGEFAEDLPAAEAKAKAEAEAKRKAAEEARKKAEAEAQARSEERTKARIAAEERAKEEAAAKAKATPGKSAPLRQETIDKGLGGLK
jgi:EpsD family peptidyl-prolyl cis-trans isomerase